MTKKPPNFSDINRAALAVLPALVRRWCPGGHMLGSDYTTKNPTRGDKRPGSFKINVQSGRWADFATDESGGDPISLAAYLSGSSQLEAARNLAAQLGVQ